MKRLILIVAVLICMTMILPMTAFAGDIPESLLYEEGAQLFFGEVLAYHPDKENPDIEVWIAAKIKGNVNEGSKQVYSHPDPVGDFKVREGKVYLFTKPLFHYCSDLLCAQHAVQALDFLQYWVLHLRTHMDFSPSKNERYTT